MIPGVRFCDLDREPVRSAPRAGASSGPRKGIKRWLHGKQQVFSRRFLLCGLLRPGAGICAAPVHHDRGGYWRACAEPVVCLERPDGLPAISHHRIGLCRRAGGLAVRLAGREDRSHHGPSSGGCGEGHCGVGSSGAGGVDHGRHWHDGEPHGADARRTRRARHPRSDHEHVGIRATVATVGGLGVEFCGSRRIPAAGSYRPLAVELSHRNIDMLAGAASCIPRRTPAWTTWTMVSSPGTNSAR